MSEPTPTAALTVLPADDAGWDDLAAVMGTRGASSRCWCQRFKLGPKQSFGSFPAEERADRLREQTGCDDPAAEATSGLVAYRDGEPVGWCAVEPRPAYAGLVRVFTVPWRGRDEDRADAGVWAVTCVLARAGHRRQGVGTALAAAAVGFARDRGARALEAYPILTTGSVITEELHVGTVSMFARAGLREVSRPSSRRVVMRLELR